MNMKSIKIKLSACICIALLSFSCRDWLEVDTPDRVMENKLFSTAKGFNEALNGVYISLYDGSLYGGALLNSGFDVLAQYWALKPIGGEESTSNNSNLFLFNSVNKSTLSSGVWNQVYGLMPEINTIIEHCDDDRAVLSDTRYNIIKGESLALRAMLHFEILRVFGPIFGEASEVERKMPYSSSSEIILKEFLQPDEIVELIYKDLADAEKLLETSDPIIEEGKMAQDSLGMTNELRWRNFRMNYYAVKALTARVAIHVGDLDKAYEYAKQVTDEAQEENDYFPFTPDADLEIEEAGDYVMSEEIIFGMYNTKREEDIHRYNHSNDVAESSVLRMNDDAIAVFYNNLDVDLRRNMWALMENDEGHNQMYFIKYATPQFDNQDDYNANRYMGFYVPIIKISEMYLIQAEAKYETDRVVALEALNKVREARNVANVPEDTDTLLDDIRDEYAREFIGEGQLFWFYKRNNYATIPQYSYIGDDGTYTTRAVEELDYFFTIPTVELDYLD